MNPPVWLGTILGTAVAGVVGYFTGWRKTSADIEKTEAETGSIAVEALERAVKSLQSEVERQSREIKELRQHTIDCEAQVHIQQREIDTLRRELEQWKGDGK